MYLPLNVYFFFFSGFGSNNSYTSSVDSTYHHHHGNKYSSTNQSFDHKSLDDQLKELDSQLLNKVNSTVAESPYTDSVSDVVYLF